MQDGKIVRLREPLYQIGATARGIAASRAAFLPQTKCVPAGRPTAGQQSVSQARQEQGPKQRLAKWRS
jgi:hypothetical protein